jgi:hypothetical protein
MAHDVFISYSTEDKLIANAACSIIEELKIRCWIAPRDLDAGVDYGAELIDAIMKSKVLVLILSASCNQSTFVKKEVEIAVSQGIIIIPFKIEEFNLAPALKFYLSTIHWLDAMSPPLEEHLKNLANRIGRIIGEEVPVPPDPPPPDPPPPVPRLYFGVIVAALAAVVLIIGSIGLIGFAMRWGNSGKIVGKSPPPSIDPCSPEAPPPNYEPEMPENSPQKDLTRPPLPPDPRQTICAVTIRNETGKPLRIWRHPYRPKDDPDFAKWRHWLSCRTSPPPPPSVAGWAYFVVENLEDNVGKSSSEAHNYYIVGWKYLSYGGFATIRIKANFFEAPENDESFSISYAH